MSFDMQISVESSPSDEALRALSRGIVDFNFRANPDLQSNNAELKFHVITRDDNGVMKGGLRALMATLPGRPRGHASHYLSETLGGSRS
ncbi:hypothetical protein E3U23_12225 [Erythrobacter litoralis]|uniref:hypothetical protein n=1 Tax=Erythrobacter litoralis TaxID=39960 RepID=UPI0024350DCC|nr:hypothetical protein [Erythrobacter litoralis]MDG6079956.1 hypothetical protein [Erythrobacter litoralis]